MMDSPAKTTPKNNKPHNEPEKESLNIKMSLQGLFYPFETGVINAYEDIIYKFEETTIEIAELDVETLQKKVKDIITDLAEEAFDEFLDLEIEELLNVPVTHFSAELKQLEITSNRSTVESSAQKINQFENQKLSSFMMIVQSIGRDVSIELDLIFEDSNTLPVIPADFNDFPTAPFVVGGTLNEFLLRTGPNDTTQINVFQEGARYGIDGGFSISFDFTRPGSIIAHFSDRIEVTTPEGNLATFYKDDSGPYVTGDVIYELTNPILHNPGVNVIIDPDSGFQVFLDQFEYTLVDSNFDSATNIIEFKIIDDEPSTQNHNASLIDEANIFPTGSNQPASAATVNGTLIIPPNNEFGADGGSVTNVTITGGVTNIVGGIITVTSTYGQLVVNQNTGAYTYTLLTPVDNDTAPGATNTSGFEVFTYTFVDADNDSSSAQITFEIVDDEPIATQKTNNVNETALFVNGPGTELATGNLITDDDGFGVSLLGADSGQISLVNGVADGSGGDQDSTTNGVIVANTTYGQISVNTTTGQYTYTLIDASAAPDGGGTVIDTISYEITDGDGDTSTANLLITIDLNQAPVANNNSMTTDENTSTTYVAPGVMTNDTDPDFPVDTMQVTSIDTTGTSGQVTFQADGEIDYDPNGQFESLAEGQTTDDTFTYTIQDAEGLSDTATVTVTITGINDAPVANVDTDNGDEGNETVPSVAVTGNVLTNDTDVDSPSVDFTVTPQVTVGTYGTLTLNADGSYSYVIDDLNATVDALNTGDSIQDVFNYTMSDNNPTNPKTDNSTLTLTINGTNDAPTVTADVNNGNEGNETVPSSAMTGNVLTNDNDVDTPNVNLTATPQVTVGTYGTLTLNADGSYSYAIDDLNATVDALNTGDSVQDVFNYTTNDNHPTDPKSTIGTLTLTINGTNDAPAVTADVNSGNEGNETVASSPMTGNVLTNDNDVDTPNVNLTATPQVTVGTYGTLTLNADGSYSYAIDDLNATVDALNIGDSVQDVFNYTTNDNHPTDPKSTIGTLTLTINGTNDAPAVTADVNSGNEGNETVPSSPMTGNVLTNDNDVDTPNVNLTATPQVTVGTYGTLTLNADGSYSYAIDDLNATVDALNSGGSVQDVFNYTVNDNHPTDPKSTIGTLTLTINGTNDAPAIANLDGDVLIWIDLGGPQTLNQGGLATVSDPDSSNFDGGTLTVQITANAVPAEDVISIQDQGTGAGQIGFDGTNVTYEGTQIGTKDVGSTNTNLIINLDTDATLTSTAALINAVTYDNTNGVNPSINDRTVSFTLTDGDGGTSNVANVTVQDLDIDSEIGAEIGEEPLNIRDVVDPSGVLPDLSMAKGGSEDYFPNVRESFLPPQPELDIPDFIDQVQEYGF